MPNAHEGPRGPATAEILIAEDSPTQSQKLRFLLESRDYSVVAAANGRAALHAARARKPALIISDVVMPELDGFGLCRGVKSDPLLSHVPVILVTTLADTHDVIRGLECGADFFLRKPYDADYLLSRVDSVLRNRGIARQTDAGSLLEITLDGTPHAITADRRQMLDLLMSTYEQAVQLNNELTARERALHEAKQRADAANRAKSAFLAVMSHEIRTPMNGVLGMLELLGLTALDAEQRAMLDVVLQSGQSLQRIIDDILDFSKIEAGKMEVRPQAASVREILHTVHHLYSGAAQRKAIAVRHRADPRISAAVRVDAVRLRQVLNNLVNNALKFTAQGHIELRAELVGRRDGVDEIRFSVEDTGSGISTEDQQRLFRPYVQTAGEVAGSGSGTGLGLAICKRLIELMGGVIGMHSEPGRGTTVTFTLRLPVSDPALLESADAAGAIESPGAAVGARRNAPDVAEAQREGTLLLMVDDHSTNRALLCRQAHALGYAAESAKDGGEALEKWRSGRFAAVITDCNMPGMDGFELARRIRAAEAAERRSRTPIMACTANAFRDAAEACFAAGMDDYLPKPVALDELLMKLDRWVPLPAASVSTGPQAPALERPRDAREALSPLADLCGGDPAAQREILAEFRRVNDGDAVSLRQAFADGRIDLVTRTAHGIKGAARMIGAGELAAVCDNIERAGHADDMAAARALLEDFDAAVEQLHARIDAMR